MRTRGEHLTYAIAYTLLRVRIPNRRGGLSEAERWQIAQTVVAKLRQKGDPLGLEEELPLFFHGPPTAGLSVGKKSRAQSIGGPGERG